MEWPRVTQTKAGHPLDKELNWAWGRGPQRGWRVRTSSPCRGGQSNDRKEVKPCNTGGETDAQSSRCLKHMHTGSGGLGICTYVSGIYVFRCVP